MSDRFQILALDGGGSRGLFTANVLSRLEDDLGFRFQERFDLITGTSAGGIIALCLGAGLGPRDVVRAYRELVSEVFSPRARRLRIVRGAFAPMYRQERLRYALERVLGDATMGSSCVRLAIPSWDAESGQVQVYKTPHAPRVRRDGKLKMVDVALATSAAPAYFAAARVDDQLMLDGGLWANNPSLVGIAEAVGVLGVPLGSIRVLNVGTMSEVRKFQHRLAAGGWAAWAPHVSRVVLRAGSASGEGIARLLVGRDRYRRLDVLVPERAFGLDSSAYAQMESHAAAASRQFSPEFARIFGDHERAGRGF